MVSCLHSGAVGGLLPGGATGDDHDWTAWAQENPEAAIQIMEKVR